MAEHEKSREGGQGRQAQDTHLVFTPSALVITLGDKHQREAQACLERSGEVKFSLKEISVSELPSTHRGVSNLVIED